MLVFPASVAMIGTMPGTPASVVWPVKSDRYRAGDCCQCRLIGTVLVFIASMACWHRAGDRCQHGLVGTVSVIVASEV